MFGHLPPPAPHGRQHIAVCTLYSALLRKPVNRRTRPIPFAGTSPFDSLTSPPDPPSPVPTRRTTLPTDFASFFRHLPFFLAAPPSFPASPSLYNPFCTRTDAPTHLLTWLHDSSRPVGTRRNPAHSSRLVQTRRNPAHSFWICLWFQHLDRSSVSRMFCLSLVSALGAISQPAATKIVLLTLAHKIVSPIRCNIMICLWQQ